MIGIRATLDPNRDLIPQMTALAELTAAMNQYLECDCDTFDCDHYQALAPLVAAVTGEPIETIREQEREAIGLIDDEIETRLRRVRRRLMN